MLTDPPHDPVTGEILEILDSPVAAAPEPEALAATHAPNPVADATLDARTPPAEATNDPQQQPPENALPGKAPAKPRPPRVRPPVSADELGEAVSEAQAKLLEAGSTGAFARDPYRIALAGLSVTIGVFPRFVRRIENAFSGVVGELTDLVRAMRHPLTETERAILTREVVSTIDRAARDSIGTAASALPRAIDRRSLALVAATLSVSLAAVGVGAFYAGRSTATQEARTWAAAQRADLTLGSETLAGLPVAEARAWSQLIRSNPAIREALSKAKDRGADPSNRPYGSVPLWLDIARTPPIGR